MARTEFWGKPSSRCHERKLTGCSPRMSLEIIPSPSPVPEATTLGAGLLAGLAVGNYSSTTELAQTFSPRHTVEPAGTESDRVAARDRWLAARLKSEGTIPELSGISF